MKIIAFATVFTVFLTWTSDAGENAAWGNACWVWPKRLGCPTNTVVEFRKTFVASAEENVELKISADTVYAVRLNGGERKIGRFPDIPPMRFYDSIRIGSVRKGVNELVVSLYVQGIGSFQHVTGDPGLMFAVSGTTLLATSDATLEWRVSCRHHADGVPLVTAQLGFSFDYDAAGREHRWQTLTEEDCLRGPNDFDLRLRPVPPVVLQDPVRERLIGQGALDGSEVPEALAVGMDATGMQSVSAERFFAEDGVHVRQEFFTRGFYLLVDLGREECGLLQLEVDTDAGVVIDIGHAEHLQNGRIQTAIGKRCFVGRYRAKDGTNVFCRWEKRMAGRYILAHVRGVRSHFGFCRMTVRPMEFPLVERPIPAGLNSLRRKIWQTSVRTLRLCMHEHYEDCPWREQALYGGDSRNQMLAGYYAFDKSNKMPELSLELLSRGLDEKGWIELCMPAKIGLSIPSFTLSWVIALGDHLDHRHDLGFLKTMMPAVRKVLNNRMSELVDDLLPCPRGNRYWQFYDWEKDLSGDLQMSHSDDWVEGPQYDAPLNLFVILAFESGARCAEAIGAKSDGAKWRQAACRVRNAVRKSFWNVEKRQMETRLGASLAPAELVQALALLADAVPEDARTDVVRKLSAASDWTKTSLSMSLYKYDALRMAGGDAERAMYKSIDEVWQDMLKKGATSFWEVQEGWRAFGNAGSLCHGWSAIPVYFYGVLSARGVEIEGGSRGYPKLSEGTDP